MDFESSARFGPLQGPRNQTGPALPRLRSCVVVPNHTDLRQVFKTFSTPLEVLVRTVQAIDSRPCLPGERGCDLRRGQGLQELSRLGRCAVFQRHHGPALPQPLGLGVAFGEQPGRFLLGPPLQPAQHCRTAITLVERRRHLVEGRQQITGRESVVGVGSGGFDAAESGPRPQGGRGPLRSPTRATGEGRRPRSPARVPRSVSAKTGFPV